MSDEPMDPEYDRDVDAEMLKLLPGRTARGRLTREDVDDLPAVRARSRLVQEIVVDGARYEQVYVSCGKKCSVCDTDSHLFDPERPGHGPYWYRVLRVNGRKVRRYMGRELLKGGAK